MTGAPLLSVRNAARHYQSGETVVRALDGASLEAHAGELIGIMGPSGSGKSTLLLICGLLEPPSAGEIYIRDRLVSYPGADLDKLRGFRRDHIGFVFQKANLIPFLTATENVSIALEIADVEARAARGYATQLLGALDLGHRIDNRPSRLSGGEQQRVAVARALANDPPLILADEPTAALDSVRGRQVMELFRRIAVERSACVMVVTHDPRSLDLFDRVIELSDGRILSEPSQPVQAHP
ncbi:ATP-binding cassette domain-containing protein [Novosphingobium sp. FGD1]|uniref:ATP-binding cassette domain-containing protein n=2 Tax=Sphingomonadaceae TaxID=41297 RepID=A0A7X4K6C2_9SPHN|nr:putative ABC transport system ATP-binding protein [Sphingobium scionense]MYL96772.1 ATP-binding cassette domain-containing protein [Novosphingobium silvae]